MSDVTVRPAISADAPVITRMLSDLAAELGDADEFASTSEVILRYGFGDAPTFNVVIAESDETPIGFALYFMHFSTTKGKPGVYVQDLWVSPPNRQGRVGQKLLAAVALHATNASGAAYMKLTVHDHNFRAEQFYTRLGFCKSLNETTLTADNSAFSALLGAA